MRLHFQATVVARSVLEIPDLSNTNLVTAIVRYTKAEVPRLPIGRGAAIVLGRRKKSLVGLDIGSSTIKVVELGRCGGDGKSPSLVVTWPVSVCWR